MRGLQDTDDDVRAVAARALLPVADHLHTSFDVRRGREREREREGVGGGKEEEEEGEEEKREKIYRVYILSAAGSVGSNFMG